MIPLTPGLEIRRFCHGERRRKARKKVAMVLAIGHALRPLSAAREVEELLRIYSGFGRWEGSPHAPGSVAIFELPAYRLDQIEEAMLEELEDVAGDVDH